MITQRQHSMPSFSFFSLVCLFVLGHTVGPATGKPVCYPYNREIWDEKKKLWKAKKILHGFGQSSQRNEESLQALSKLRECGLSILISVNYNQQIVKKHLMNGSCIKLAKTSIVEDAHLL